MRPLRIGTRGSKLALAQAVEVKCALEKAHAGLTCKLVILKTSGDDFTAWKTQEGATQEGATQTGARMSSRPLKGLFVKEIEEALLKGEIELAVHSVKDLQTELPNGLTLAAILPRQDPRDALVVRLDSSGLPTAWGLQGLPARAKIGASSLRRQAQLKRIRRDLDFVPIRGNVDTRLRKLDSQEVGALVLAACGLIRLGLQNRITEFLEPEVVLPAAGQGALGAEVRSDRKEIFEWVAALDDPNSHGEIKAERAFLKALGGGCQVPVGALARVKGEELTLTGCVLSPDGLKAVRKEISGPRQAAERLGTELASFLRAAGADRLLFGHWAKPEEVST